MEIKSLNHKIVLMYENIYAVEYDHEVIIFNLNLIFTSGTLMGLDIGILKNLQ